MKDIEEFFPADKHDWRSWLESNHQTKEAVWIIFYRQSSPNFNLSWSESVDEALCFGWIDSTKRKIDDEKYIQYFSKRKPKSNWSKVNKDKVAILIAEERMQAQGYASIEIAKENGSWTFLDPVEALEMPDDLKEVLENHSGAMEFYDSLSNSIKKMYLYWVLSAKRTETRKKRILEIATTASENKKPKHFL